METSPRRGVAAETGTRESSSSPSGTGRTRSAAAGRAQICRVHQSGRWKLCAGPTGGAKSSALNVRLATRYSAQGLGSFMLTHLATGAVNDGRQGSPSEVWDGRVKS